MTALPEDSMVTIRTLRRATTAVMSTGALLAAGAAHSHHSPIIFDTDSVIVIEGEISRFDWMNPHTYIFVSTVTPAGERLEWQLESDATPILARNGWSPTSLSPGEHVAVRANPDRNAERAHALLISLEKDDGQVLTPTAGDPNAPATPARRSSLAGIWEQGFQNFLEFRSHGLDVRTTAAGTAARASYDIRSENPVARCVPYPSPTIIAVPQHLNEIRIADDRVEIHNEFFDVQRTIWTDGRGHPESGERTNQGHSIGRWENGDLIVDTRLFADHRSTLPGTGLPSGAGKHVVERYTLTSDGTGISIDVLLEDPEFLAEPFRHTLEWRSAGYPALSPFTCSPEQAVRFMFEPQRP
jgi:hypothetical protein